jgi:trehalose-phosphatase
MTRPLAEVLPALAARLDQADQIIIGLDFDGTLVPIRSRPEDVHLSPSVREKLERLEQFSKVSVLIVSGRALPDVRNRVGLPSLIYAGNHGLEIDGPHVRFREPSAEASAGELSELLSRLGERLREVPGSRVESKGLTASVHDRNVPPNDIGLVEHLVRQEVATRSDRFVVTPGNRVWEIRPRVDWNKGRAMEWILSQMGDSGPRLVFYVGDDRTDEDAFRLLSGEVTIRVGDDVVTRAAYSVSDPDEVERLLEWLIARLETTERR